MAIVMQLIAIKMKPPSPLSIPSVFIKGNNMENKIYTESRLHEADEPGSEIKSDAYELISLPAKIGCLDHGFVRLVDSMGDDLSVSRSARVSYDAAWRAGEDEGSDQKLINYLWKHRHTTPFESVTFTFEVKAPIFVFRQWHRHRIWSFNELSARYKELPEEFYVPDPEMIGIQATNNKQGREIVTNESVDAARRYQVDGLEATMRIAFKCYHDLVSVGWPRELARSCLPVATYSHMFCTVNLLNLMKFMTLRCDSHAQYEIRVYADAMRELVRPIVPVCIGAWEKSQ